jgi:hypothetical protein
MFSKYLLNNLEQKGNLAYICPIKFLKQGWQE